MKVLFLNLFDDPAEGGGAEVVLQDLAQLHAARGIEAVILSTSANSGLHAVERDGVRVWRAGLRNLFRPDVKALPNPAARLLWHALDSYNVLMQPYLKRVLEVERPDVVSIHNLPGWSAAAWRTIADSGIPAVQVLHDAYAICPRTTMYLENRGNCAQQCHTCRLFRLPHRKLSRRVSAVVGVSQFILDRHLQAGYFHGVTEQHVIHNARDARELGVSNQPGRTPGSALRIGFIGRLDPGKGIEMLLQAFSIAALPNAELWIAGEGVTGYERFLRSRYASNRVHFLGRVSPRDFYSQVDIVIVPSLWNESLGTVIIEALSFGKPVIGSRRGGTPEMINDDENGLLFEPDRPRELVAALQRVASDSSLRSRMSAAAQISAKPFLDRDEWLNRYIELYARVTHQPLSRIASVIPPQDN